MDLGVKIIGLVGGKINASVAKQFMLDVISIVFEWNERFITDKEAMNKVVRSLLKEKSYKNNSNYKKTSKKSAAIISLAAGLGVFLFVFVTIGDYTNVDSSLVIENGKLVFEQLQESSP